MCVFMHSMCVCVYWTKAYNVEFVNGFDWLLKNSEFENEPVNPQFQENFAFSYCSADTTVTLLNVK